MINSKAAGARRPGQDDVTPRRSFHFPTRAGVQTDSGRKPAARLRPGDVLRIPGFTHCAQVLWVAVGARVTVICGRPGGRRSDHPSVGHVSPETGKLVLSRMPRPGMPGAVSLQ